MWCEAACQGGETKNERATVLTVGKALMAHVTEIAPDLFRITTFVEPFNL